MTQKEAMKRKRAGEGAQVQTPVPTLNKRRRRKYMSRAS
jgi:hypothetical protein